jgi:hypothetical protein
MRGQEHLQTRRAMRHGQENSSVTQQLEGARMALHYSRWACIQVICLLVSGVADEAASLVWVCGGD